MSDEASPATDLPIPPLKLPVGSVRALITLGILGTTWAQLLRGDDVADVLRVTLLLVLGYYFGARAGATQADKLAGVDTSDRKHPLYLPKGSVRLLIVIGFGAVAYQLHKEGHLVTDEGVPPVLILVATFLLGSLAKGALALARRTAWRTSTAWLGHVVAAGTLAVVYGFCLALALGFHDKLPPQASQAFVGVVGFYLGKR